MRIEFLYFDDCPNHEKAEALLSRVLQENQIGTPVERIAVETDEDARRYQFVGSPTIRVNGKDVDPSVTGRPIGRTCRVYLVDGKFTGLPTREMIESAVGLQRV